MKQRPRKVKSRKAALARAGYRYEDLARLAHVGYSMAWKWMNDERTSTACLSAYEYLVTHPKRQGAA
jgi:hypothetical protein